MQRTIKTPHFNTMTYYNTSSNPTIQPQRGVLSPKFLFLLILSLLLLVSNLFMLGVIDTETQQQDTAAVVKVNEFWIP